MIVARGNDYDMVYNVAGMNAENSWNVIRSPVYANHVFSGSVQQSPHTTLLSEKDWSKNLTAGPGKGRGALQKGFDGAEKFAVRHNVVGYIPNFLK